MLTKDEAELYDRQIRLWGVNAQSQIRQSKVLMLGFGGVASEVAKILVLAGIDTLTIVDNSKFEESDLYSNLFCRPTSRETKDTQDREQFRTCDVVQKLKRLNPLVKVNILNTSIIDRKPEDFEGYNLVTLHSFLTIDEISKINSICRERRTKFYLVLDFGFFGFMFNDLGQEFRFNYEVFDDIGEDFSVRQSGEKGDPISLHDDAPIDASDKSQEFDMNDEDDYESEDDGRPIHRPKKKRRINSPVRGEPVAKSTNDKKTKIGSLPYVTFQDMISIKSHSCTNHTSPVLFAAIAMLKFYSQSKHLPRNDVNSQSDNELLLNQYESITRELNIKESVMKKFDENWIDCVRGSLSPVCAVLGGVAGQDMIRALSNKDIPINNTFSFNGISMNGVVEKVGLEETGKTQIKPIIRDFIEIDD